MSAHHPFTLPQEETAHELEGDLAKVPCHCLRYCLERYELGGGSLRYQPKRPSRTYVQGSWFQPKKQLTNLASFLKPWTMVSHHTVVWLSGLTDLSCF